MSFEDAFPPAGGPPAVLHNTYREVFAEHEPWFELYLDSGAFRALWEVLESTVKYKYPTWETYVHVQALIRVLHEIRRSAHKVLGETTRPPSAAEKGVHATPGGKRQATGTLVRPPAGRKATTRPNTGASRGSRSPSKATNRPGRASGAAKRVASPTDGLSHAAGKLLVEILDSTEPVGKQYLSYKTGITGAEYSTAIKELVSKAKVAQVGAKAAAKYKPYRKSA